MTSPLTTLSQYANKSVVPLDVCTQICATHLASAFTGHANIFPSNAPWYTHAPLNEFSVRWYVMSTPLLPTAPICLHEGVEGKGNHKFSQFEKRDVINWKLLSSRLSAPLIWCSIPPNTQTTIKCNHFQVSHCLLLWRVSFPMSPFSQPVRQVNMYR